MMIPAQLVPLQGSILYFDCSSGISGDMTVGALVDLGVPEEIIRRALAALPLTGYSVGFTRVMRGGLSGTKFLVEIEAGIHTHHAGYRGIRRMLEEAPLDAAVRQRASAMFARLAAVEAKLHGVSLEEVHFHEVGAVDAIVDMVAASAALAWLAPVETVARRVPLGSGWIDTAHGRLALPAPAALALLEGAEVEDGGCAGELTTPTGAAILASCVSRYGGLPPLSVIGTGWGAGDRELADRPNLLRIVAGRRPVEVAAAEYSVIEANIDDMTPEMAGALIDILLAAGARDAWITPVLMKKGRPGWMVAALADGRAALRVETALLRESTTIGLRRHVVERSELERRMIEVTTPYGAVPIKLAVRGGAVWNAAPEFESCRKLAVEQGVPLKRVLAAALAAYHRHHDP